MEHNRSFCVLAVLLLSIAAPARADVPAVVSYQGYLQDAVGTPLNSDVPVTLGIWSDPVSTDPIDRIYDENHLAVPVVNGLFNVLIGNGDVQFGTFDASVFDAPDRWLEVTVAGEILGPRRQLTTVAFAFQSERATSAGDADTLDGLDSSDLAEREHNHAWSELTGVPAGFSDSVDDDTQLSEAQVDTFVGNNGYLVAEADPQVGTTQNGRFCKGTGASVNCDQAQITSTDVQDLTLANSDISAAADIAPGKILGTAAQLNFSGTQSFDAGTLQIDAANNRIGIGVAPAEQLDVSGDAQVSGEFRYASPKSRWHYLSASQFTAQVGNTGWRLEPEGHRRLTDSGVVNARADVQLPNQATVTAFTCYYYDQSSAEIDFMTVQLRRRQLDSPTPTSMAVTTVVNSTNSPIVRPISTTNITDPLINTSFYQYEATVFWDPSANSTLLRFYGCRISYEVGRVSSS